MYICYLKNPHIHANAVGSHPGIGRTREEARENSTYWQNQLPWTRVVPQSRAPQWAIEAAIEARRSVCPACDGPQHLGICIDRWGDVLSSARERAFIWQKAGCPAQYRDGSSVT